MFENTTLFLIPIWFDDLRQLKDEMAQRTDWEICPKEDLGTDYLLHYAYSLTQNSERFVKYRYRLTGSEDIYRCQDQAAAYAEGTRISEISLQAFGTGIAFAGIRVVYENLTQEQISDFIYRFKAVGRIARAFERGRIEHPDAESFLTEHLPDYVEPFFYVTAGFKRECLCYTCLKGESITSASDAQTMMYRLGRGYSSQFALSDHDSTFDLLYQPYENDRWSGSQEGLANFVYELNPEQEDYYINNLKPQQLMKDYLFMYLLLLNQRFTSLKYIEMVAEARNCDLEDLNKRILDLKTIYVFRVIANDLIYQNLYTRMYKILELDSLLIDLKENEEQMVQYYNHKMEQRNKISENLLVLLSGLTVFSSLVDMSDYLDKFQPLQIFAKWISLFVVLAAIVIFFVAIYRKMKK